MPTSSNQSALKSRKVNKNTILSYPVKHLISIFDSIELNELKKSYHFVNRTSSQYTESAESEESRIVEYNPETRPFGWIINSFHEVDQSGNQIGKEVSLAMLTKITGVSEDLLKKVITVGLSELTNQKWIETFEPTDGLNYHSVKLGKIGLSFGTKTYSPILHFPSINRSADTAWLSVREVNKVTTLKFFPWNITPEELTKDAVQSINSENYKINKEENHTRALLGLPDLEKAPAITINAFKSDYKIVDLVGQKKFFNVIVSSGQTEEQLISSVKRAFGHEAVPKSQEIQRGNRGDQIEKARAEHGKYLSLEQGSVFMYKNLDQNNKNLEYDKFTPITVLAVKKITDRERDIEVRNQKTGRTFIMKLKPGDTIKLTRPNKEGTSVPHTAKVGVTDNTPQNRKRVAVTWLDQAEE